MRHLRRLRGAGIRRRGFGDASAGEGRDCAAAYSDFDSNTMVCAGFPQGGVDTSQGDSGGPMFGRAATGELRVVGATSFGEGCARPGKPGRLRPRWRQPVARVDPLSVARRRQLSA